MSIIFTGSPIDFGVSQDVASRSGRERVSLRRKGRNCKFPKVNFPSGPLARLLRGGSRGFPYLSDANDRYFERGYVTSR